MKILIVSQYFWPENFRINDLVKDLNEKNMEVDVLTGQPNYPKGKIFSGYRACSVQNEKREGINIYRVPLVPRGKSSSIRLTLNYFSFVLSGIIFGPFLARRKRYDIIFVYAISPILQAIPAIFLKWFKGHGKVVLWVQDLWPESLEATGFVKNRAVLALVQIMVKWIYQHVDLILVQSEAMIDQVAKMVDREKICFYPNSADDIFELAQSDIDSKVRIEGLGNEFSIVFAGNLGVAQSLETVLDAASFLLGEAPSVKIFLVGEGSQAIPLRKEIERRNLSNIRMVGSFPKDAMPGILSDAHALLVTLKDEPILHYVVPSKIQTYMAAGRPIIACLNGEGRRVVVEAKAGVACEAENGRGLADVIRRLVESSVNERMRLGLNGRDYFLKNYESTHLSLILIKYFERLVKT